MVSVSLVTALKGFVRMTSLYAVHRARHCSLEGLGSILTPPCVAKSSTVLR